jgi:hypothetical protein
MSIVFKRISREIAKPGFLGSSVIVQRDFRSNQYIYSRLVESMDC